MWTTHKTTALVATLGLSLVACAQTTPTSPAARAGLTAAQTNTVKAFRAVILSAGTRDCTANDGVGCKVPITVTATPGGGCAVNVIHTIAMGAGASKVDRTITWTLEKADPRDPANYQFHPDYGVLKVSDRKGQLHQGKRVSTTEFEWTNKRKERGYMLYLAVVLDNTDPDNPVMCDSKDPRIENN